MHEANLHNLNAEMTIGRGDWDAYLREVELNGGATALEYAQCRVQRKEAAPDYEGEPMLRRILSRSRAAIVHSDCVGWQLRGQGFAGPIKRIPHGAWIPSVDRPGYRSKLGLDETTPLIGAFGFLKPYKRIAESLRAFRRLLHVEPGVKMILVGEPHPGFPLARIIEALGLSAAVRVLGFTPIEEFVGYISACDIVLNLRFPTVGENSGTLMRALGLGKAVIVSDVGSFCELPEGICLKVPVDASEQDRLLESLTLLVSRPDLRQGLGERAQRWVQRECNWTSVSERYVKFLDTVAAHASFPVAEMAQRMALGRLVARQMTNVPLPEAAPASAPVEPGYIQSWASDPGAKDYIATHISRLTKTLEMTPLGGPSHRILEMGSYLQITPALKTRLGYGEVRGCYYGPLGGVEHRKVTSREGEEFECDLDLFDAEKDRFPYEDEYFSTVLCCELIEHLSADPMHLMSEMNRILKPAGHLLLTTPNIGSLRAIAAILQDGNPGLFTAYMRPPDSGVVDARHNREYTPKEIRSLLFDSGFEPVLIETGNFRDEPHPEFQWVYHLLRQYKLSPNLRGDGIFALGRKEGPVRDRYPGWLYVYNRPL